MDPLIKKVLFVLMVPVILIGLIIAIPHILPQPEADLYPWLWDGIETLDRILYDEELGIYRESQFHNYSYWVCDNSKVLNILLEDYDNYQGKISNVLDFIDDMEVDGYPLRRIMKLENEIVNSDVGNLSINNRLFQITGNASDPGKGTFGYRYFLDPDLVAAYVSGQRFYHDGISYAIERLMADQSQNPGFDRAEDPWYYGWDIGRPLHWNFDPNNFPLNVQWTSKDKHSGSKSLFLHAHSASMDWRTDLFSVSGNTSSMFDFWFRSNISASQFEVYLRWFDSGQAFISQEFIPISTTNNTWTYENNTYTSPVNSAYADVWIRSIASTEGWIFLDDFGLTQSGNQKVPNGNAEEINPNYVWPSYTIFRSKPRAALLYTTDDSYRQWLIKPINASLFANVTFFAYSSISAQIDVSIFYSDYSYDTVTFNNTDPEKWNAFAFQQSSLTKPTATLTGFEFDFKTTSTRLDDISFNFHVPNSTFTAYFINGTDSVGVRQKYEDDEAILNITHILKNDRPYVTVNATLQNKKPGIMLNAMVFNAFDGLSTVCYGYRQIYIPGVGKVYPSGYVQTFNLTNWKNDYVLLSCHGVPEWSGTFGLACIMKRDKNIYIANSRFQNSTYTSPENMMHYVTIGNDLINLESSQVKSYEMKVVILNGHDFVKPEVYDAWFGWFDLIDSFASPFKDKGFVVDFTLNYHIGAIIHALSRCPGSLGDSLESRIWTRYKDLFEGQSFGCYPISGSWMIFASLKRGNTAVAQEFANYLLSTQDLNGANKTYGCFTVQVHTREGIERNAYLDVHGACLYALGKLNDVLQNSTITDRINLGISTYHFSIPTAPRLPPHLPGMSTNVSRIWIWANATHIDDDFWTFKSVYTALGSYLNDYNWTMIAMGRVWSRTVWNDTDLIIYVPEYTEGQPYETNTETGPWGLHAWYEMAKWQRENLYYYWMFQEGHKFVHSAYLSTTKTNATLEGTSGITLITKICTKGKENHVVPISVKVNGANIGRVDLEEFEQATRNVYFYNESFFYLKSYPLFSGMANIEILWDVRTIEPWMPIMPILGLVGFIFLCLAPVYLVQEFKNKHYFEAMAYSLIFFIVGVALIIGWLWG